MQIDYDREMALVLIRQNESGETELYSVVRLVADPDQERTEFAIIIGSVLTGQGLGPLLLRRIFGYARRRGIKEVYGEALRENQAMLRLCAVFGFRSEPVPGDPSVVRVVLKL